MMLKKYSGLGFSAVLGLGFCTVGFAQQDTAPTAATANAATPAPSSDTSAAPTSVSAKPSTPSSAISTKPSSAVVPTPTTAATVPAPATDTGKTATNTASQPAAATKASATTERKTSSSDTQGNTPTLLVNAPDSSNSVRLPTTMKADALDKEAVFFPRYTQLKPAVAFWTQVFGEYSENQSVIHSMEYPQKVFQVLDFRSDAARMSASDLDRLRDREIKETKDHYDSVLKQVHELRRTPDQMNSEQRRIYDLYADIPGDNRFLDAVGTLRSQRGLKERTQQALQISDKYLPSMEATFRSYDMPVSLTRLPLVESSFNVEAYSKAGAAGLWQFIPSSARIYMRLNNIVDDRRDPWTSTDAAARHLKDDYRVLGDWPLAITAYNHGRGGIARALTAVNGTTIVDLIQNFNGSRFGFAGKNYYAEFLAAIDVERKYAKNADQSRPRNVMRFDVVETKHYVPYETLRRLCGANDEVFRMLNPAYRPEVIEGKMYVPPGHLIRVPAGSAKTFEVAYSKLSSDEKFDSQRSIYELVRVKKGDSLARIAKRFGISTSKLASVNGISRKHHVRPGQILKVPPHVEGRPGPITVAVGESKPQQTRAQKRAEELEEARTSGRKGKSHPKAVSVSYKVHKVKSGQTLSGIAKRYNTSVDSLREANNLGSKSHITPGQKLKIPTT